MTEQTLENPDQGTSPNGTTSPTTPPTSEPSIPAVEGAGVESKAGEEGAPVEGSGEPPPASASPKKDWRDDRLAKLTAQKKERDSKIADLEAKLAAAAKSGEAPKVPNLGLDEAEVERRAQVRAAQLAEQAAWDAKCNGVVEQGRKDFTDFNDKVTALRGMVDESDPKEATAYQQLIAAAIETGEGHKLIHRLGGDPEEAQRILALPPVKMAIELTKLAVAAAKPAVPNGEAKVVGNPLDVSAAPKPINVPGRGAGAGVIDPTDPTRADKLSGKEWIARRNQQIEERNKQSDRRARA